jgi:glycosyltransferase involved in cell wall biosynthesis
VVTVIDGPGRGASAARNAATGASRGVYLQYLDADDLLEPNALATRVDALERTSADVAISDWQRLVEDGGTWCPGRIESGRLPPGAADLIVFRGFWAPPAAILYRRTIVDRIGGWSDALPVIQDARFLFDAARASGAFAHVPGVGAHYRQHRTHSLSSRDQARFWRDVLHNSRDVERLWRSSGAWDAEHQAAVAGAYEHCARIGLVEDQALFEAARLELDRLEETPRGSLIRAADVLTRVAGYEAARALLAPFWYDRTRSAEK